MWTSILLIFASALGIACMAQKWRGRTGIGWFFLTGLLEVPMYLFLYFTLYARERFSGSKGFQALGLMVFVLGSLIMGVIVAMLPRKDTK